MWWWFAKAGRWDDNASHYQMMQLFFLMNKNSIEGEHYEEPILIKESNTIVSLL
jgi:hypothetical protein